MSGHGFPKTVACLPCSVYAVRGAWLQNGFPGMGSMWAALFSEGQFSESGAILGSGRGNLGATEPWKCVAGAF